jgi:hypothetical protein
LGGLTEYLLGLGGLKEKSIGTWLRLMEKVLGLGEDLSKIWWNLIETKAKTIASVL